LELAMGVTRTLPGCSPSQKNAQAASLRSRSNSAFLPNLSNPLPRSARAGSCASKYYFAYPNFIAKNYFGAGDGIRTRDLLITNQLLCQLSYASNGKHL
jgi:hypothetical protein